MISKPLAFGLLAAGCLTAAAGGAYLATRSNAADSGRAEQTVTAPAQPAAPAQPVSESEGLVAPDVATPDAAPPAHAETPAATGAPRGNAVEPAPPSRTAERPSPKEPARSTRTQTAPAASSRTAPAPQAPAPAPLPERPASSEQPAAAPQSSAAAAPVESPRAPEPAAPPVHQMQEVVVPASSVLGLQVDNTVSSERARVEDRVQARVTRDVMAGDRVAIPAGSRVLGTVTSVERGGKVRERARLDVRFHTLVLADGTEVPMRTETISRYGESPTGDSARKIGGAAIGGAILGAIIGGGKGAVIGGATGAAGGTAVVMAGDRSAATLPAGTVLSVRVTTPMSIEVEK